MVDDPRVVVVVDDDDEEEEEEEEEEEGAVEVEVVFDSESALDSTVSAAP